jgi:hypothetical protein
MSKIDYRTYIVKSFLTESEEPMDSNEPIDNTDPKEDASNDQPQNDVVDAQEQPDQPDQSDDMGGVDASEPDIVSGTGDVLPDVQDDSDDAKVKLFTDTASPETDWGLTNENNIKLAKFRFDNAGIDISQLMTDVELEAIDDQRV